MPPPGVATDAAPTLADAPLGRLPELLRDEPTLAALAYLTPPALGAIPPGVNPSSVYCSQLGGTDAFGGVSAAGWGWVLETPSGAPGAPGAAPGEADVLAMVEAVGAYPPIGPIRQLRFHGDSST